MNQSTKFIIDNNSLMIFSDTIVLKIILLFEILFIISRIMHLVVVFVIYVQSSKIGNICVF